MTDGHQSTAPWRASLAVWMGWLCFALFLQWGPPVVRESLERSVIQTAGAVLTGIDEAQSAVWSRIGVQSANGAGTAEADPRLIAENRRLTLLVAELHEKLSRFEQSPPPLPTDRHDGLLRTEIVPARVLGIRKGSRTDDLQWLLGLERQQGLVGQELVLTGEGVLIDRGEQSELSRDMLVSSGEALFGRTVQVGRWTTVVQPITDPAFRMAVRIVRHSPLGPVFGSRGILAGTGSGCRLDEVPATEPVAVGDRVYTEAYLSPMSEPIYCGRVTRAEVDAEDTLWTIEVAPANAASEIPSRLGVLKSVLSER